MAIWEKNCPRCGGELDENRTCNRCGYSLITGISGNTYLVSSSAWTSPAFSAIADTFGEDIKIVKKTELKKIEYIDDETLDDYTKWGYLCKSSVDSYSLTELGKESAKRNRRERGKTKAT